MIMDHEQNFARGKNAVGMLIWIFGYVLLEALFPEIHLYLKWN